MQQKKVVDDSGCIQYPGAFQESRCFGELHSLQNAGLAFRANSVVRIVRMYAWMVRMSAYSRTYVCIAPEHCPKEGKRKSETDSSVLIPTICYSLVAGLIMVPNDKHGIGNQIDGYCSFPKCQSTFARCDTLLSVCTSELTV